MLDLTKNAIFFFLSFLLLIYYLLTQNKYAVIIPVDNINFLKNILARLDSRIC